MDGFPISHEQHDVNCVLEECLVVRAMNVDENTFDGWIYSVVRIVMAVLSAGRWKLVDAFSILNVIIYTH